MSRRPLRTYRAYLGLATAASLVVVATVTLTGTTASAAPVAAPQVISPTNAVLRGAHFSPDTPGVDVYLTPFGGTGTSTLWLSSVGYGDVSAYKSFAPGVYAVSMRLHGASAGSPAALSWTLDAQAGQAYTAAAVGMNKQLTGIVLHDQLTPPAAGQGLVRVIQAASRAPQADVATAQGPVVAKDAAFATSTDYASVPSGTWPIQATAVGSPSVATSASVSIPSGSVSSIVLLDGKDGGITLKTVQDAASATVAPGGSVDAGAGGTAPGAQVLGGVGALRLWLLGIGVALAALGAVGLLRGGLVKRTR